MLAAVPPRRRSRWSTMNDTFSMWVRSGRMWSRNRPGNTMIVSNATDPVTAMRPTAQRIRMRPQGPPRGRSPGTRENEAVNRRSRWLALAVGCIALTACGGATDSGSAENLSVSPQNTSLVVGVNRLSLALLDQQQNPVHANGVSLRVLNNNGATVGTAALTNIGPEYGGIPVYTGVTKFPDVGQYEFIVSGSRSDGQPVLGHAYVTVAVSGIGVAVGAHVPPVSQAVLGVPGVTLATLDSGIPPDSWHDVI